MTSSDLVSDGYRRAVQWRDRLPEIIASVWVLVVGDVMLDRYWFGDVHRISPEAPVPVVQIRNSDDRLGGAANVARNVASLGAQTTLMGIVGEDEATQGLRALLDREAITAYLQVPSWPRYSLPGRDWTCPPDLPIVLLVSPCLARERLRSPSKSLSSRFNNGERDGCILKVFFQKFFIECLNIDGSLSGVAVGGSF